MTLNILKTLFIRDLEKLRNEIIAYKQENSLWLVSHEIPNSGGNLCLHLLGNLQTYVGAELGKTGYIRDRPLEFSARDVPRQQLIAGIDTTIAAVNRGLSNLTEDHLNNDYPLEVLGERTSIGFMLIHLLGHLNYHLGQINYHRRLLDTNPEK